MSVFGKVDGILFHQGESDNHPAGVKNYDKYFTEFLSNLKDWEIEIPIYLARASLCGAKPPNKMLTAVQDRLIANFEVVKEGPSSDLLHEKTDRLRDGCHFTLEGSSKLAAMWVESINAGVSSNIRTKGVHN